MPIPLKDQFRNDSGGVTGVVIIENGNTKAIAVGPGDFVWLSEEEQAMTANAPKREEDNPLVNGTLTLVTEGKEIKHARPLRPPTGPVEQEVGAPPAPAGPAPTGTRAPTEEVGTPDAVSAEVQTEVAHDGKTIVKKAPQAAKESTPVKA